MQCDIKHTYQIGYWVIFPECLGLLPHTIVPNNYLCLSIEYIYHHITQGYLTLTVWYTDTKKMDKNHPDENHPGRKPPRTKTTPSLYFIDYRSDDDFKLQTMFCFT